MLAGPGRSREQCWSDARRRSRNNTELQRGHVLVQESSQTGSYGAIHMLGLLIVACISDMAMPSLILVVCTKKAKVLRGTSVTGQWALPTSSCSETLRRRFSTSNWLLVRVLFRQKSVWSRQISGQGNRQLHDPVQCSKQRCPPHCT